MEQDNIKKIVKEKYSNIAIQSDLPDNAHGCGCGSGCCSEMDYTVFSESYDKLAGYAEDADLGLGCGIPTEFAGLQEGQHVLDLGSGAGNDCFVARAIVDDSGHVTGLDFSDEMLTKARKNAQKLGYANVDFVAGDIEDMPFDNNRFDVVLSNCVLNLVPDKEKAFAEIMRVLKPGGHFCVSDVVLQGQLPEALREDAEMYAGCVSGAMQLDDYLHVIDQAGFSRVTVHKQRRIDIPLQILKNYLNEAEVKDFLTGSTGLFSVTVSGEKNNLT
jgi:arsenite methyltransferase